MFLVRKGKKSKVAHIFINNDTACRMYSTGGMNKNKYKKVEHTNLRICEICKNNAWEIRDYEGYFFIKPTEKELENNTRFTQYYGRTIGKGYIEYMGLRNIDVLNDFKSVCNKGGQTIREV